MLRVNSWACPVAFLCLVACTQSALARPNDIDLVWDPPFQSVTVGQTVELQLLAISGVEPDQSISVVEAILLWEQNKLELLGLDSSNDGYAWLSSFFPDDEGLDGLNGPFPDPQPEVPGNDGDAWYNALRQFPPTPPAQATPTGLIVTTIQFQALETGVTQVEMPPSIGLFTLTRILPAEASGFPWIGEIGPPAVIEITNNDCVDNVDCDDMIACTDDTCELGGCLFTPNDANCADDGEFCNGTEFCDGATGCSSTGDPCAPGEFCNETTDVCDECQVAGDCDDGIPCTDNSCAAGTCVYTPNNSNCADDGNFCNGTEVCNAVSDCVSTGDPCAPGEFCNEATDVCDECQLAGDCDDGIGCTDASCVDGSCSFTTNDANCPEDGLFCNGVEFCQGAGGDPVTGCTSPGPPCPDCTEESGCLCEVPVVAEVSSRYIQVSPIDTGLPQALLVTICDGATPLYVGAWPGETGPLDVDLTFDGSVDGTAAVLVDDPADALYLTSEEWGGTVWVTGLRMLPGSTCDVQADCGTPGDPSLTAPVSVDTWQYGDVNNNLFSNLEDVFLTVQAFQQIYVEGNTRIRSDIGDCLPNLVHNLADSLLAVKAFQLLPFSVSCPESFECP
ncbi:MAG: hypothetical protein ACYTHJ_10070 [Planctomycetota bacterium]|jgi:hypothetical protein